MRTLGAVLYTLGLLVGGGLLVVMFLVPPMFMRNGFDVYVSMAVAAMLAFPACLVYLWVPVLIDRYDPEPWWCLALAFFWGAIPACGFSAVINTVNAEIGGAIGGKEGAEIVGAVISAPFVEEGFKGLAVLGMFWFLRREFDGVVDGVIYATFTALGFAAVENVIYYSRASMKGGIAGLTATFIIRGIIAPWGHPLYTSMTGIGIGIARETNNTVLKFVAPIGGYLFAVMLHAIWNGSATFGPMMFGNDFIVIFLILLLGWFVFVFAFGVIVVLLVRREGKIIRQHLQDEVLLGNMSQWELDLVCSPFGRMKALMGKGGMSGRRFVDAASRLGLSKWHAARAMKGQKRTISMDFIVPLRQELHKLRQEIQMGR
jgi:protease PrsW